VKNPTAKLKRPLALICAVATALLLVAPAAFGAELTRAEYVDKVEPICMANTKANEKILKGVRGAVKDEKLDKAAGQLNRAATALEKTVKQLKATPQPTEDEATLRKWLGYVSTEATLLRKTAQALGAGNKFKAQSQVVRLNRNETQANNLVAGFGFSYCKFIQARFV
jgi:hypothetical protein